MTPKRYVWISEPGTDGRIWTVLPAMGAPVGDSLVCILLDRPRMDRILELLLDVESLPDLSQHADAVASEASATLERLSAESPEQPS